MEIVTKIFRGAGYALGWYVRILLVVGLTAATTWATSSAPASAPADHKSAKKIKAVLWIGGAHHDFESAAKILVPALEKLIPVDIKIVKDASFLDSPEQLDVILMHHCYDSTEGAINKAQQEKLLELVRNGVGVVGIHASYYSFVKWDEYHKFYGTRFIKHGSIDITVVVRTVDKKHPIMEKLDESFEVTSELYESMPLAEDCHVLALAKEKGTSQEHPSVWTRKYGKGRIVAILPAHWPRAYKVTGFQKLIANSTLWVSGRLDTPKTDNKEH